MLEFKITEWKEKHHKMALGTPMKLCSVLKELWMIFGRGPLGSCGQINIIKITHWSYHKIPKGNLKPFMEMTRNTISTFVFVPRTRIPLYYSLNLLPFQQNIFCRQIPCSNDLSDVENYSFFKKKKKIKFDQELFERHDI